MTVIGDIGLALLALAGMGAFIGFTIAGVACGVWVWRRLLGAA